MVDFDRAGRLLLSEFRAGQLGVITLETPAMRQQEEVETQERLARLEEKRVRRREKRATERAMRKDARRR
jgi:ribosome biogenesis GTPase A